MVPSRDAFPACIPCNRTATCIVSNPLKSENKQCKKLNELGPTIFTQSEMKYMCLQRIAPAYKPLLCCAGNTWRTSDIQLSLHLPSTADLYQAHHEACCRMTITIVCKHTYDVSHTIIILLVFCYKFVVPVPSSTELLIPSVLPEPPGNSWAQTCLNYKKSSTCCW